MEARVSHRLYFFEELRSIYGLDQRIEPRRPYRNEYERLRGARIWGRSEGESRGNGANFNAARVYGFPVYPAEGGPLDKEEVHEWVEELWEVRSEKESHSKRGIGRRGRRPGTSLDGIGGGRREVRTCGERRVGHTSVTFG
jgi:hypothetical protein